MPTTLPLKSNIKDAIIEKQQQKGKGWYKPGSRKFHNQEYHRRLGKPVYTKPRVAYGARNVPNINKGEQVTADVKYKAPELTQEGKGVTSTWDGEPSKGNKKSQKGGGWKKMEMEPVDNIAAVPGRYNKQKGGCSKNKKCNQCGGKGYQEITEPKQDDGDVSSNTKRVGTTAVEQRGGGEKDKEQSTVAKMEKPGEDAKRPEAKAIKTPRKKKYTKMKRYNAMGGSGILSYPSAALHMEIGATGKQLPMSNNWTANVNSAPSWKREYLSPMVENEMVYR